MTSNLDETERAQRARRYHGARSPRGLEDVPRSTLYDGFFGRMFRSLPPVVHDECKLIDLGCGMFTDEEKDPKEGEEVETIDPGNNPVIEAGYTYLGQFIDHDITFDPTSRLQRQNDPDALVNFRTPRYDLDSVYGAGPDGDPYLYEDDGVHLRTGLSEDDQSDLLRTPGAKPEDRRALIPDPRNDENLIISQLHLAFINYHNRVADVLSLEQPELAEDSARLLAVTQRTVRWHYQWIVVHEFLTRIVGEEVVKDVLGADDGTPAWLATYPVWTYGDGPTPEQRAAWVNPHLRFFHWRNNPFMPVEFAAAAFRFGHSMIRDDYAMNGQTSGAKGREELPTFRSPDDPEGQDDLRGFRHRPKDRTIDWRRFFTFPDDPTAEAAQSKPTVQMSRLINTQLATRLAHLPHALANRGDPAMREALPEDSACADLIKGNPSERQTIAPLLATRNLLRGQALGLPSGQSVAVAMGLPRHLILGREHFKPTKAQEVQLDGEGKEANHSVIDEVFWDETPLWYYILKEAEVFSGGKRLGPVGGRIVAEVLIGLLYGDPQSYLRIDPAWTPTTGLFGARTDPVNDKPVFGMPELLGFPEKSPSDLTRAKPLGERSRGDHSDRAVDETAEAAEVSLMAVSEMDTLDKAILSLKEVPHADIIDLWDVAKHGEAPAIFMYRRRITPDSPIPQKLRPGLLLYYVESVEQDPGNGMTLLFERQSSPEGSCEPWPGYVEWYGDVGQSKENDEIRDEAIPLDKGHRIVVSNASYGIVCLNGAAVLLLAGIEIGQCSGHPCP
ncbi:MAG: hypothetical protein QOF33_2538 [Thermomicrobiales bacterium]|jgi:hypothetical protein|nr:hypothetical protein [Thermomicrobiales bacterium]